MLNIKEINKDFHKKNLKNYLEILNFTYENNLGHLLSAISLFPILKDLFSENNFKNTKTIFMKCYGIQSFYIFDKSLEIDNSIFVSNNNIFGSSFFKNNKIIKLLNKKCIYFNEFFGAAASKLFFEKEKYNIILSDAQTQIGEFYEFLLFLEDNKLFNNNFLIDFNQVSISSENNFNLDFLKTFNQNFYIYKSKKGFFLDKKEIARYHWKELNKEEYEYLKNKLITYIEKGE